MDFEQFKFHPAITARLTSLNYLVPTPIQKQAIPFALQGRDVLGLAQTGTGKTAAFALPILQRLTGGPRGRVRALVIAPTRELAEQIHESFKALGGGTGLRSATVYGGVGPGPQIDALSRGVEIIVACPGRLLDHMQAGKGNLSGVETLVLDEADQMLDMGFWPTIREILRRLPQKRQSMLFSATMPEAMRKIAGECLRDPMTVSVNHGQPLATVAHALYPVPEHLKSDLLLHMLKHVGAGSVLVFTRTKHRAKRLGERLEKNGFDAASLQGNLSQNRRKAALDGFRDGTHQILVATDIAARGIDVSEVTHVINYDVPMTPEAYTHRIGRTGRAARNGDAFTLVTNEDEQMIRSIEKIMGKSIERRKVADFDYSKAPSQDPAHKGKIQHPRGGHGGHGGQQHHRGGGHGQQQNRHGGGHGHGGGQGGGRGRRRRGRR